MNTSTVVDIAVLGFAIVGAVAAGNAASQIAERNGCTEAQSTASSCVAVGLSMAVLPATAVAGAVIVGTKIVETVKDRKSVFARAREEQAAFMAKHFPKKSAVAAA